MVVSNYESEMVMWCTKPGHGTRLIPEYVHRHTPMLGAMVHGGEDYTLVIEWHKYIVPVPFLKLCTNETNASSVATNSAVKHVTLPTPAMLSTAKTSSIE
ncbi:hypothetical protein BDQ17DRAFT_1355522 [Cyathus striatus]|nr:hypothetical protein BDQ17DRAFT_1355522 [Cyathus striatus]